MTGKEKCKYLKEIRQRIADDNDIAYVTEECTHKGECRGTCPRCESELRYLERELEKRKALGKSITIAGLAVGLAVTATGCENPFAVAGNMENPLDGDIAIEMPPAGVLPETTVEFPGEIVDGEMVEYFPHISSVINDNPRVIADKLCGIDAKYLCDEWSKAGYYVEEKENNTYVYKYEDTVLELTYVDFETITCVVVRYSDGSVSEYKRTPDKTTEASDSTTPNTDIGGALPLPVETMGEPIPQD